MRARTPSPDAHADVELGQAGPSNPARVRRRKQQQLERRRRSEEAEEDEMDEDDLEEMRQRSRQSGNAIQLGGTSSRRKSRDSWYRLITRNPIIARQSKYSRSGYLWPRAWYWAVKDVMQYHGILRLARSIFFLPLAMTWTFFRHPSSSIAQALTPFFWPAIMLLNYNLMVLNAFYGGIGESQAWMRGQWATLAMNLGQTAPGTDPWTVFAVAAHDAQRGALDFLLWPVHTIWFFAFGFFGIIFLALAEGHGGRVEGGESASSKRKPEEAPRKEEQSSEETASWSTRLQQVVAWSIECSIYAGVLTMLCPFSPFLVLGWVLFSVTLVFIHGLQAEVAQRWGGEALDSDHELNTEEQAALLEGFRQTWLWTLRGDLTQLANDPVAQGWSRLRSRLEGLPSSELKDAIARLQDGEFRLAVLSSLIGPFERPNRAQQQTAWTNPLDDLTHPTGQRPLPTHAYSFITRFRSAWNYWMQEFHPEHPAEDVESKWLEMVQMLGQLQVEDPDYVIGLLRLFEQASELSPRETREKVYEVLWERETPRLSPRATRRNSIASRPSTEALSPPTTPARRESDERLERDLAEAIDGPMPPEGGQGISGLTNGVASTSSDEDDAEPEPAGPDEPLPRVRPVAEESHEGVLGPAADSSSDSDNFVSFSTDWSTEDRGLSEDLARSPGDQHGHSPTHRSPNQGTRPAASNGSRPYSSVPGAMITVPYASTTAGPPSGSDPIAPTTGNSRDDDGIFDRLRSIGSWLCSALGFVLCGICGILSWLESKPQPGMLSSLFKRSLHQCPARLAWSF